MNGMLLMKKEAVEEFGSDKCKAHYAKHKKFKNKTLEKALEKTLEQNFMSVKKVKQGRSYVYELGARKEQITPRSDKRVSNGMWSSVTHEFDMNILLELFKVDDSDSNSYQVWLKKLTLVNDEMMFFNNLRYNDELYCTFEKEAIKQSIIFSSEKRVFKDIWDWNDKLKAMLISSCNRLVKLGLLKSKAVFYGFKLNGFSKIKLKEETFNLIKNKRQELLQRYEVNLWYVKTYKYSTKSKDFLEAWEEYLKTAMFEIEGEDIPLKNVFIEYIFDVSNSENSEAAIKEYIHFYSLEEYMNREWDEALISEIEFKAEESVMLARQKFGDKVTESVLKRYKNNLEKSAAANGFEEFQDVFEEWAKSQLTSFEQKYIGHHLDGSYALWVSKVEWQLGELIKFNYLEDEEIFEGECSPTGATTFDDRVFEEFSEMMLSQLSSENISLTENLSSVPVQNNRTLESDEVDWNEGTNPDGLIDDETDVLFHLRKFQKKGSKKRVIDFEASTEKVEMFVKEMESASWLECNLNEKEEAEPSEYNKMMMYEYFKECNPDYELYLEELYED